MEIKNIHTSKYFKAIDTSKITELFGLVTNNLKQVSLAYAILGPDEKTRKHIHNFLEIYIIEKGKGTMYIKDESKAVKAGDCILIPEGNKHFIENNEIEPLEFYCICVPAFNETGTVIKEG